MRFSKSFIAVTCILLVSVGAALGYSVKVLQGISDIDHELKLIEYDLRGVEYRIFILEAHQLKMEPPPGDGNI